MWLEYSRSNFVVNFGTVDYCPVRLEIPGSMPTKVRGFIVGGFPSLETDGAFYIEVGREVREFRDGLSKTAMGSELLSGKEITDLRGIWFFPIWGGAAYNHRFTPNSSNPDSLHYQNQCDPPISLDMPCATGATETSEVYTSARSKHPGGVNVVFGDGHVAFISDDVSLTAVSYTHLTLPTTPYV